jgi:hypothetical protein
MFRLGLWACVVCLAIPFDLSAQLLNGSDFQVNVATFEDQGAAHVVLKDDRFAVVFHRNGSGAIPYFRLFDRGAAPLTTEIALSGNGGAPDVANHAGGFIVVYQQLTEIRARRFDASGVAVGADFRVNQYITGNHGNPRVAEGPDGGFVVAWAGQGDGDAVGIFAARFDAAGNRLTDDFAVNGYTSGNQFKPSIAFSGGASPEFIIVWGGQGANDGDGIFARRFAAAGAALTNEFRVNTSTSGATNYPSAAANPSSTAFVVTWHKTESSVTSVFGQRIGSTGAFSGPEFQVNTTSPASHPSVAFEPSGAFIVTYTGIRGRRFTAAGAPVGSEFLVSTATTGVNSDPAVAASGPGTYVVAWTNSVRDGNGSGVYGQLFGPRGDANGDGFVDIADVFYLINFLFAGGPPTFGAADADGVGGLSIADVFFLINYLYAGGPAPAA